MKTPSIARCGSFTLLSFLLFGEGSHGFCPATTTAQRCHSSALSLVPGQGNQLAAAYTASLSKEEQAKQQLAPKAPIDAGIEVQQSSSINEPSSSSSHWRALAASRSFVQRVFHLPSSAIKKHPHPTLEGLKEQPKQQPSQSSSYNSHHAAFPFSFIPRQQPKVDDDYVLYPLVGFQFVKSSSADRTIALPTTSHAACRLPTNRNEEVYGWFSPGCKLDLYSEDVCHAPIAVTEETTAGSFNEKA